MNINDVVRERIEAAERKAAARKRDRAAFAAARSYGLARRHAAKLRYLAERRAAATDSVSATDEQPPDEVQQVPVTTNDGSARSLPTTAAQRPSAATRPGERP